MRTFDEVWCDLEKLKGEPVFTLVKHIRNNIIDVKSTGIKRRSEIHNQEKTVDKSGFKRAWEQLLKNGYCEISKDGPITCACLANLPEVEYTLNPNKIWLTENRHEFGKLVKKTR